jgi:hypothetical protein
MQGEGRSKLEEWRNYFHDRGVSERDVMKAMMVHEVPF